MVVALSQPASVLAVGGLDPSGGGGILQDVAAIRACGLHAAAVATLLTEQSTQSLRAVMAVDADFLLRQVEQVFADLAVAAVKIGALANRTQAEALSASIHREQQRRVRLGLMPMAVLVDPVFKPSRGRVALTPDGAVIDPLKGVCSLITPNWLEAEVMVGTSVQTLDQAKQAASALRKLGWQRVLLKGGHGKGEVVTDILVDGHRRVLWRRRRWEGRDVRGTGCALASRIAAEWVEAGQGAGMRGDDWTMSARYRRACRLAGRAVHQQIGDAQQFGNGAMVMAWANTRK